MTAPIARFKLGDRIWCATTTAVPIDAPCPVCFGQKAVTVILGNGDHVIVECDYCAKGHGSPRGIVTESEFRPVAKMYRIERVSIGQRSPDAPLEIEYQSDCTILRDEHCFATEDEAIANAAQLAEQRRIEQETRAEYLKKDATKTYVWNAGYHTREAAALRRRAESHERRAMLCKAKEKTKPDADTGHPSGLDVGSGSRGRP